MTISLLATDRPRVGGWRAVALVAALVLAAVTLPAPWIARLALGTREQLTPVVVPAGLVLYWAFGLQRRTGVAAGLGLTVALFLLPLLGLWLTGASNFAVAGGLVPWSDAGDYYYNAQRLLERFPITEFSARRALFVGLFASLLELTGRNLQIVLLILVALNAVASYGAARAVQRTHGRLAAVVLLLLLFLYYRRIAGTTLTENLGFALGALAFTLLWGAARSRSTIQAVGGIAVLTMALNARNGPFLVLPPLIVWVVFMLCEDRAPRWRAGAIAVLLVAAGFAASSALVRAAGVPGGQAFSDFPDTFYGIAAGGKRWVQIYVDHPEVAALPLHEHNKEVMRLAWNLIFSHPGGVLLSTATAYGNFLGLPGPFHFIDPLPPGVENIAYRAILSAFSLWATWMVLRRRSDPHASLLVAALAGILLSVPFIPPVDSDRLRIYAATVPLTAALVAVGAALVGARLSIREGPQDLRAPNGVAPGVGAAVLLLLSGVGALAPWRPTPVPAEARIPCADGLEKVLVRRDGGSTIQVLPDVAGRSTRVPVVSAADFQRQLAFQKNAAPSYTHMAEVLSAQEFPAVMSYGPNLETGKPTWLIAPPARGLSHGGVASACGAFVRDSLVTDRGVFTATAVELHSPGQAR